MIIVPPFEPVLIELKPPQSFFIISTGSSNFIETDPPSFSPKFTQRAFDPPSAPILAASIVIIIFSFPILFNSPNVYNIISHYSP